MTTDMAPPKSRPSVYSLKLIESMLVPSERVVHIVTISNGIYWHGLAFATVGLGMLYYSVWLASYVLVVSAVMLALAYSTQRFLVLAATDHRVIVRAGIVNQQLMQLRYHQIESVDVMSTAAGMMFGYGSVIVTGTGRLRMIVPFVRDAVAFRDHLTQKLLEREEPIRNTSETSNDKAA